MVEPDRDLDALLSSLPWRDPVGYQLKHVALIHIQECTAGWAESGQQVRYDFSSCRHIVAIYSKQVVVLWGRADRRRLF